MNNFFSKDLPASIVVFLVALPLCLGVALASGAPLIAGLISGIVGGIVVGILSQSHVSVSGPAAGLTVVVLSAITAIGSFQAFLLAVVLAGVIQIILGYLKGGFIANFIPANVIKGLLASIGLILILKQIPHAFGVDKDIENDFSFWQPDGENTFSELLNIVDFLSLGAMIISAISIAIIISWNKIGKKLKFIPSSLVVVALGLVLNQLFIDFFPSLAIASEHLVSLPEWSNASDLLSFPDIASIGNRQVWISGVTIAIVASLETLLNLEAVELMDVHKRKASPNRELVAQGVGNMTAGLLGGIPVTSVIVRSSVNIDAGGTSKWVTISHGVLILVSVLFLSPLLNMIPLSSLATILILTGYKLTKPSIFVALYKKGKEQFIPFLITVIAIVFTDLLSGVLIGLAASFFFILRSNYKFPFSLKKHGTTIKDEVIRIELPSQVTFLNKATLQDTLWNIAPKSRVMIDARYATYIYSDVLELIENFRDTYAKENDIQLNIFGLKEDYKLKDNIDFVNVMNKEIQEKLSVDEIIELLKQGNERFVNGNPTEKYLSHQMQATSQSQHPVAVAVSCMDSRTTVEHIFDLGFGSIFSIRIAGNVLNEDILGSIEYAVKVVGVKLILVIGHTKCGAIKGACDDVKMENLTPLLKKIKPAINKAKKVMKNDKSDGFVDLVAKENVLNSAYTISQQSGIIDTHIKNGKVKIVGCMYDLKTGKVTFL